MNTMLNGSMTLAQREPGPTGPAHTKQGANDELYTNCYCKFYLICLCSIVLGYSP